MAPEVGLAQVKATPVVAPRFAPVRGNLRRRLRTLLMYLLLVCVSIVITGPIAYAVSQSLRPLREMNTYPPQLLPPHVTLENFRRVFETIPFGMMIFNSFKIAALSTFGSLLSCSMAAYAFAQLHFVGRDRLFLLVLATMMIPGQVTSIPVFIIMRKIGWMDTHEALYVPAFFASAYGIFFLRQFFLSMSQELFDAARIDGSNPLNIYWQIVLPLAKPALATLGVFGFIGSWNDLYGPAIYLTSWSKATLTLGLTMYVGRLATETNLVIAGAVLSIIPSIILFTLTQNYFVRGIVIGGVGVKG